jgi:3-oxoacyl-[acyl-carrier-protein] synthase II
MESVSIAGFAGTKSENKQNPAITGVGLVTPLGDTAGKTWDALLAGRFIVDHSRLDKFAGAARVADLAEVAAAEAMAEAGWTDVVRNAADTALIVATSKGPVEAWIGGFVGDAGIGDVAARLARSLKFGIGPRLSLSAACASGLHALSRGLLALESGEASRALVVAVEASAHPLFISSFQRLGVLAPEGFGCRPFDVNRNGFVVSEAAAAVCLEFTGSKNYARVENCCVAGDASHLTGSDPEGKSLRNLLRQVAGGRPVDLIHAHSTATVTNDPIELAAIRQIAGEDSPIVYSHKGALGHSLGAAGLLSVVLNCLCHRTGMAPGNVQSSNPMPTEGLTFSNSCVSRSVRRSLALAAGFGGALGAVSLVGASG